jgi:hypothetical protein
MSWESLFNLGFEHWKAFLLAFIPAIITLIIAIHIYAKFPDYRINNIYLLFLFSMFVFQLNDALARLSMSEETARSWDRLLIILWILILPSSFHWALLLTGIKKIGNDYWIITPLYFSAIVFSIPVVAGLYVQPFTYMHFFGWVRTYDHSNFFLTVTLVWWCLITMCVLFLFGRFAYMNRKSPYLKYVSGMNFIGYSIAAVGGIICQVAMPYFFKIQPVPIASTLMLSTVFVVLGLNAYKLFSLSESLDTEMITGIIQEIVFVVSPDRSITYINPYGEKFMKVSNTVNLMVKDIFSESPQAYNEFETKFI